MALYALLLLLLLQWSWREGARFGTFINIWNAARLCCNCTKIIKKTNVIMTDYSRQRQRPGRRRRRERIFSLEAVQQLRWWWWGGGGGFIKEWNKRTSHSTEHTVPVLHAHAVGLFLLLFILVRVSLSSFWTLIWRKMKNENELLASQWTGGSGITTRRRR